LSGGEKWLYGSKGGLKRRIVKKNHAELERKGRLYPNSREERKSVENTWKLIAEGKCRKKKQDNGKGACNLEREDQTNRGEGGGCRVGGGKICEREERYRNLNNRGGRGAAECRGVKSESDSGRRRIYGEEKVWERFPLHLKKRHGGGKV